jgi:alkylation response protein AidB-like acyl-CoA dehydrogenase
MADLGVVSMALPVANGGMGTELLDLSLVCEILGAHLAPVPLAESVVAARLAARVGGSIGEECVAALLSEGEPLSIAVSPPVGDSLRAVPAGAAAYRVLFLKGDELRVTTDSPTNLPPPQLSGAGTADRSSRESRVVACGAEVRLEFGNAVTELKALTAASLCGAARRALSLGVEYARTREAFGVPIASFQALAHRFADLLTEIDGAQLIAYKAAWAHDSDTANAPALSTMAYLVAGEAAGKATEQSLHVFGGYGFMLEYDIQLYVRYCKSRCLVFGDLGREPETLASLLWRGRSA